MRLLEGVTLTDSRNKGFWTDERRKRLFALLRDLTSDENSCGYKRSKSEISGATEGIKDRLPDDFEMSEKTAAGFTKVDKNTLTRWLEQGKKRKTTSAKQPETIVLLTLYEDFCANGSDVPEEFKNVVDSLISDFFVVNPKSNPKKILENLGPEIIKQVFAYFKLTSGIDLESNGYDQIIDDFGFPETANKKCYFLYRPSIKDGYVTKSYLTISKNNVYTADVPIVTFFHKSLNNDMEPKTSNGIVTTNTNMIDFIGSSNENGSFKYLTFPRLGDDHDRWYGALASRTLRGNVIFSKCVMKLTGEMTSDEMLKNNIGNKPLSDIISKELDSGEWENLANNFDFEGNKIFIPTYYPPDVKFKKN